MVKKGAEGQPDTCAFKVYYVCDLNVVEGSFREPIEEKPEETDRARIHKCGSGIPSRGMVPTDPAQAELCTGKIFMISDKDLIVQSKKKEWVSKLLCC